MKPHFVPSLVLSLALSGLTAAQEVVKSNEAPTRSTAEKPAEAPRDPAIEAARKQQEALTMENLVEAERLKKETNVLRAEITRLKMERELMGEKNAMEDAKRIQNDREADIRFAKEKDRLIKESELARIQAEKLATDLKTVQSQSAIEITKLQNDIARIETNEKRSQYADSKPEYLTKPLREDGVVVVSDRRIPLNGPIGSETADFITDRIDFWNNKDSKLPIFIVIDECPGGSVMAGYRILKSMESSKAPIHVVVKSFAASMAACITTLAEESYCYPNAVILHHQISSTTGGAKLNLTQQKEFYEASTRWWERLAGPIAKKMGITSDELIKKMYDRSSSGDWTEFGDKALELKWVNHIISGVEETSFVKDPDSKVTRTAVTTALKEEIDADGKPHAWLPRLNPMDCYFLYNPDGYYRTR
jgi:ATP-dependent Clp protease, protease subunit